MALTTSNDCSDTLSAIILMIYRSTNTTLLNNMVSYTTTTRLVPASRPLLRLSISFFISICIQVSPAHTSKQAMRRNSPNMDAHEEQRLQGPRLKENKSSKSNARPLHHLGIQQALKNPTGVGPITKKYHVPWSSVFWCHETYYDAIIFFATHPGQKLTLQYSCFAMHCSQIYASK